YDNACHSLSVPSDSLLSVSPDSIAAETSSLRFSPISSPIFLINGAILCGSFSSSPARLLGSAKDSSRASSDFGEANRDRIRSTRALAQWEQATSAWLARLNTRTVLRFLQSRQRYSNNGIDQIPLVSTHLFAHCVHESS